ncbi:MAG: hypothetical protein ACYC2Y_10445 [Armatimonadota bacterium]
MRLKRWMILVSLLVLASCAMAEKVVTADRFQLTDSDGNVVAVLACTNDRPVLAFTDSDGNPQFTLTVGDSGCTMAIGQLEGEPSIYLNAGKDHTMVLMRGPAGETRLALGVLNGEPTVAFFDSDDNILGEVLVEDGEVVIKDAPEEDEPK